MRVNKGRFPDIDAAATAVLQLKRAMTLIRGARHGVALAGAPNTLRRFGPLMKSLEGAIRHADRRLCEVIRGNVKDTKWREVHRHDIPKGPKTKRRHAGIRTPL